MNRHDVTNILEEYGFRGIDFGFSTVFNQAITIILAVIFLILVFWFLKHLITNFKFPLRFILYLTIFIFFLLPLVLMLILAIKVLFN